MTTRENLNAEAPRTKRATEPRIPLSADDLPPTGRGMVRSTDDISVVGVVTPAASPSTSTSGEPEEHDFLAFATRLNTLQMLALVTLSFLLTGTVVLTILLVAGAF